MRKVKFRLGVVPALMWRITALTLGIWLIAMVYLTSVVARSIYLDYLNEVETYVSRDGLFDYDDKKDELENKELMISHRSSFYPDEPEIDLPLYKAYLYYTRFLPRDLTDRTGEVVANSVDWSVTVYDHDHQMIMGEDNHIYFLYRDYYNGTGETADDHMSGYTYINLNRTECGRMLIDDLRGKQGFPDRQFVNLSQYRFIGYFDGDEFVLQNFQMNFNSNGSSAYWSSVYEGEVTYEGPVVTIYPEEVSLDRSDCQVSMQGRKWTLEELGEDWAVRGGLEKYDMEDYEAILSSWHHADTGPKERLEMWNSNHLLEAVIARSGYYFDQNGERCEYAVVLRVEPVRIAISMMTEIYLLTIIPLALILVFYYFRIRKELKKPLGYILKNSDMDIDPSVFRVDPSWKEPGELFEIFRSTHLEKLELKKKNTQFATALDYAQNAEENRRRMVSDITHELKTPLTVIHSYAEGLKEGIAADKQNQYLDVILEETQRMDGMVLEMLDLSRLEAGKVRLATDRFSLLELTRRVIDKLSLLVEEKELTVEYVWAHDCEITADESRITQALTNLVSNAIKYSPRGGTVHIGVTRVKNQTMFSIENQSEPLSEEALAKIWDSFYRTDKSRTEKGTGLGLPITKAIIELHGGTCHVSNTKTGVEFKFYLL